MTSEAVVWRYSVKKVFLEFHKILREQIERPIITNLIPNFIPRRKMRTRKLPKTL